MGVPWGLNLMAGLDGVLEQPPGAKNLHHRAAWAAHSPQDSAKPLCGLCKANGRAAVFADNATDVFQMENVECAPLCLKSVHRLDRLFENRIRLAKEETVHPGASPRRV